MQGIKVNLAEYYRLTDRLEAKAVLAFSPETIDPQCRLHVRVFCDYYDVPEDPATGSANGCLCAWLVRHRYLGVSQFAIHTEQGVEMKRPSLLYLQGGETSNCSRAGHPSPEIQSRNIRKGPVREQPQITPMTQIVPNDSQNRDNTHHRCAESGGCWISFRPLGNLCGLSGSLTDSGLTVGFDTWRRGE